ncbi:hypothetical protein NN561_013202 [Cricetulus griseus]
MAEQTTPGSNLRARIGTVLFPEARLTTEQAVIDRYGIQGFTYAWQLNQPQLVFTALLLMCSPIPDNTDDDGKDKDDEEDKEDYDEEDTNEDSSDIKVTMLTKAVMVMMKMEKKMELIVMMTKTMMGGENGGRH